MTREKTLAWGIGLASLALLAFSGWAMASRIVSYHKSHPRHVFAFQEVLGREFSYAGRPVTITRETENGAIYERVRYGDAEIRLRATVEENANLPDKIRQTDWMRIFRFVPVEGETIDSALARMHKGEIQDRLVIVTRTPPPGADPATWGAVWRKGWTYDLHEFSAAGGFDSEKLGFPTNRRGEPPKPGELRENTWQMQAALQLMPKGRGPNYNPKSDALSSVGWTLPVGGASVLGIIAAFVVGTPRRRALSVPA